MDYKSPKELRKFVEDVSRIKRQEESRRSYYVDKELERNKSLVTDNKVLETDISDRK